MYGSTARVDRLRKKLTTTIPRLDSERALIVTKAYQETEGEPTILRRAKALKKILSEMTIFIEEDELIVGNKARTYKGTSMYPEYQSMEWFFEELDSGDFEKRTTSSSKFLISEEDKKAFKSIREYWRDKNINHYLFRSLPEPEEAEKVIKSGVLTFGWPDITGWSVGHFIPNFQKVLEKGFLGIQKDAQKKLKELGLRKNGRDIEKYFFWKAIDIVCDAVANFAKRYADLAISMAESERNDNRKKELLQIAANCSHVPANPARTFWEACQSLWFVQLLLAYGIDLPHPGVSVGRFDQYMYPYYKHDVDQNKITKIQAQELIECLWLKMAGQTLVRETNTAEHSGYSTGQNITIGGQTPDGRDATNDLTYMSLNATANLKYHDPPLSVRIWDQTPNELWNKVIEVTKIVSGMPAIFNDEVIIPQLISRGISLKDARNYAIVGCVEPSIPGKEFPRCGGTGSASFFNLAQCFLLAINNVVNPLTGQKVGLALGDLSTFKSFDEVKESYQKQIEYFVDWHVTLTNMWDIVNQQVMPMPLVSCVMDSCVERGVDVTAGGAKYNAYGLSGVGTANVADALAAIKKLVFEEKKYSGSELLDAIRTNWKGKEKLRNELINKVPKYGNDDDYVDELARWLTSVFINTVNESTGPTGRYNGGLWPVGMNVRLGKITGATLDGRKTGEPLADGISPCQGRDKCGPTAVLKSVSAIDHFSCYNGTLLNMKFHPKTIEGNEGLGKLRNLIQTYFDMKGSHIQYNVVSNEILRDAQKNPEMYKDLIVRVAGYSAYFVELGKDIQDDIIARTEY